MIKRLETQMWEAAKSQDSQKFLTLLSEDAVMVCGGFRCSGYDYAQIIKDFDCKEYKITDFEVVSQDETTVQVHYVIETEVNREENKDLAGKFHITSTWKRTEGQWKLIFNMDSRILF